MSKKYDIILYPFSTEKTSARIDIENILVFVVDKKATKTQIKKAVEDMYNMKVKKVRTMITPDGIKKAYVKFSEETPAIDLATKLGIL